MHDKKNMMAKNIPPLLVISMAIAIFRCNTARITQYRRSRATLDATGRRHRASPSIAPLAVGRHGHLFWREKNRCGFVKSPPKLAFKRYETDPQLSTSKQQAS